MTELPEFVESGIFVSTPPFETPAFGGVSGDEYGLSDISVSLVY